MSRVFLTLGPITFQNDEVPERINFGGDQGLAVKQLIGGQRVVDALGRIDDDISFSGMFFGSNATFRAKFLDSLRVLGTKMTLTWSTFNFQVVIKSFKPSFERTYQIPFSITLQVVQDLNKPFLLLLPVGYSDAILAAMTAANDIATILQNPGIESSLLLVQDAINAIPDLGLGTNTQIASVLGPLGNSISLVSTTIETLMSGSSFL